MNVKYCLSCADDHIVEILLFPGFCSAVVPFHLLSNHHSIHLQPLSSLFTVFFHLSSSL